MAPSPCALSLPLAVALAALPGCRRTEGPPPAGGEASPATAEANRRVAQAHDLSDPAAFADARRGLLAVPHGQVRGEDGEVVWDFDSFAFVEGEPPPTVNPSLWRQARLDGQVGLFEVAPGIHQLRGFDLANLTLIEGRTGWIVVDPLTARETAAAAMAFARQHLGDHRVSAILFTHSHVDHFGGALGVVSAEEAAARALPVVAPAGFLEEATSENVLMGPAMARRSMYMYGSRLPRSPRGLVDEGLGRAVAYGRVGILPPTLLVERTGQEVTLDGVRFVFQSVPGSEAPAEITFLLPEKKAWCGAELVSHTMHNLYTLRGAKVRDALRWAGYVDEALEMVSGPRAVADVEVTFGSHHWPVWGRERIAAFLTAQRDVYRYIHDQTVRMMNAGMGPGEIAEGLRLPRSLDAFLDAHGYYGTVRHNARAVYQFYLGWYDANPASLDPLPREEAGRRWVELAGGAEKLLAAARAAHERADYRWAAELLSHMVFADPRNAPARPSSAIRANTCSWAMPSRISAPRPTQASTFLGTSIRRAAASEARSSAGVPSDVSSPRRSASMPPSTSTRVSACSRSTRCW
jgi:alkyl sulfatase BDS1-like metallo-beta-lactamase superfamily hydrolase